MDALSRLSPAVSWGHAGLSAVPSRQLVAVTDTLASSGAFMLHHFLALHLKNGVRTVVLSGRDSQTHCMTVARKLGVGTASLKAPLFSFVDLAHSGTVEGVTAEGVYDSICGLYPADPEEPLVVIVDDVSMVEGPVGSMLLRLKADTRTRNIVFVVGCHADADCPVDYGVPVSKTLRLVADTCFAVSPLPSGHSVDVHGEIAVTVASEPAGPPTLHHFKVLDGSVKVFRVGESRV